MSRTRIVVFAKAPEVGKVKTRLIPELGRSGARDLAQELLSWTCRQVGSLSNVEKELCGSPAPDDPRWAAVFWDHTWLLTDQGEGDLGQRLAHATARSLGEGHHVILIGTDCPSLTGEHLAVCVRALEEYETVMIPAVDGGYVLLGVRYFDPLIFQGIAWSTSTVAEETRKRIAHLGWSFREWPALPDIDEPGDLRYLPEELKITLKGRS